MDKILVSAPVALLSLVEKKFMTIFLLLVRVEIYLVYSSGYSGANLSTSKSVWYKR